jgi:hypothetical protein
MPTSGNRATGHRRAARITTKNGPRREIGLQPSTTGEPDGKETGQSVMHYIVPGGPFARAYATLAAPAFSSIGNQSRLTAGSARKRRPAKRNTRAPPVARTLGLSRTRNSFAERVTRKMTEKSRSRPRKQRWTSNRRRLETATQTQWCCVGILALRPGPDGPLLLY